MVYNTQIMKAMRGVISSISSVAWGEIHVHILNGNNDSVAWYRHTLQGIILLTNSVAW